VVPAGLHVFERPEIAVSSHACLVAPIAFVVVVAAASAVADFLDAHQPAAAGQLTVLRAAPHASLD
jgi:hypothetical protein